MGVLAAHVLATNASSNSRSMALDVINGALTRILLERSFKAMDGHENALSMYGAPAESASQSATRGKLVCTPNQA